MAKLNGMDKAELDRTMLKFSRKFGENTAQAVNRWSVQTARELARFTQPFGTTSLKKIHTRAMWFDAGNVIIITRDKPSGAKALRSEQEVINWINQNRTKRGSRTRKLDISQKKVANFNLVQRAIRIKLKDAGEAKGAWIGAGQDIARAQRGPDQIKIGVNFAKFAQKHVGKGSAKPPKKGFSPTATIKNNVEHSSNGYALSTSRIDEATEASRRNTIKWYQAAMRRLNRKRK